jgi:hypothetical protein
VPASAEALTNERHAGARARYAAEAEAWREAYAAEHGVRPPETLPRGSDRPSDGAESAEPDASVR